MYLERAQSLGACSATADCPTDWSEADLGLVAEIGSNCRRTCYRTDRACYVMYLERMGSFSGSTPCTTSPAPECPDGWSEADEERVDKVFSTCVRTCYYCP